MISKLKRKVEKLNCSVNSRRTRSQDRTKKQVTTSIVMLDDFDAQRNGDTVADNSVTERRLAGKRGSDAFGSCCRIV